MVECAMEAFSKMVFELKFAPKVEEKKEQQPLSSDDA
jgi:hypothetical protein